MGAKINKSLIVVSLLGALLLSGCGGAVAQEVWLNGGGKWEARIALTLNPDERTLMGSDLEEMFEKAAQEAEGSGDSFEWSQSEGDDGSVTYDIKSSGSGLDALNQEMFDDDATIYKDEQGHVHIRWNPYSTTSAFRKYALTIHGGKIISSNADEETKDSVTWYNPSGRIEVEMTEKSNLMGILIGSGGACACIAALVVIVGGAGVFLVSQRKKQGSV